MAEKAPVFTESALGVASQLELQTQVTTWKEAEEKLAAAKAAELELRLTLVNKWFPNFEEGTNTGQLREKNLKCVMPMNRTVVQAQYLEAWEFATKTWDSPITQAKANNLKELLELVFKPVYELRVGVWKDLSDEKRKRLADLVIEKPGTPSLALMPRK